MNFWTKLTEFLLNVPPYGIIYPNEGGVFLRGGHYKNTLTDGFFWKWPLYDSIQKCIITTQVINLPNQSVTTKDGHIIAVSGAIEYSISDARKALLCIYDYDTSLQNLGMAFICHYLNRQSLKTCGVNDLEKDVLRGLRGKVEDWGLCISKFWVTDFAEHKVYRIMAHDIPVALIEPEEN